MPFQTKYGNEVLKIIRHVEINFTFMGSIGYNTVFKPPCHVMPLTLYYKLQKN
jgi:hypothetical protein